jgi:hypothetical protein
MAVSTGEIGDCEQAICATYFIAIGTHGKLNAG